MYTNVFGTPARPAALLGAAVAVVAATVAVPAAPAHAAGGSGSASAVTARVDLNVAALDKAAIVPLHLALNEVSAPNSAEKKLLSARVKNVAGGAPVDLVKADAAHSSAAADSKKAEGYNRLVNAEVHLPGVTSAALLRASLVVSRATCVAGKAPVAHTELPGKVQVLGKTVVLDTKGTVTVDATDVGTVKLTLREESTTKNSAAATALRLGVSVDPLKADVAEVKGEVVLARAACTTPAGGGGSTGGATGGSDGGATGGTGGATGGTTGGATGGTGGTGGSGGGSGSAGSSGGQNAGQSGGQNNGQTSGQSNGQTGGSESPAPGDSDGAGDDAGTEGESGGKDGGKDGGNLAETGGGSTLAIAGVATALVAGGGALVFLRRRKGAASAG